MAYARISIRILKELTFSKSKHVNMGEPTGIICLDFQKFNTVQTPALAHGVEKGVLSGAPV